MQNRERAGVPGAALHTGECDMVDGKVGGIAAEIGAQVANEAAPNEVLVSSTVKDLVAGSGIRFEDRGATGLQAFPASGGSLLSTGERKT